MTKTPGDKARQLAPRRTGPVPQLKITKLRIVSRDYRHRYPDGYRDFGYSLHRVLKLLDGEGCDAVLFSLFSIRPRELYKPPDALKGLRCVRTVLLEEFSDGDDREAGRNVLYYRPSRSLAENSVLAKSKTEKWGE
jgi:hypothetical protein